MYERITPISDADQALANTELAALGAVWLEQKGDLEDSGEYRDSLTRLEREWAVETGILERLYTWDRGVTEVLIERGIDASIIAHRSGLKPEMARNVTDLIQDQLEIVEGLFEVVKGDRPLIEHFIRGLQTQFTAHQETTEALGDDGRRVQVSIRRGAYKMRPNNPRRSDGEMHEYCPPELVEEEMARLVG